MTSSGTARAAGALLFSLFVACGGAEFAPIDDADAAKGDGGSVTDAGRTDDDGARGDDGADLPDASADAGAPDAAPIPIDAPASGLCCTWRDAGAHATACGPGDWACVLGPDAGAKFESCYLNDAACPSSACILNDNSHGNIYGVVTLCP